MKHPVKAILVASLFLAAASCTHSSAREHHRITHLQSIDLHAGVNKIEMLVPDGRAGLIVTATESTGNPTKTIYLVMLPDNNGIGWDAVTTGGTDAILMADGANTAMRFAKGWLDGSPETFLFVANRAAGVSQGPAAYDITTYRLVTGRDGASPSGFEEISKARSDITYSNADAALQGEVGTP